ncbi:MAG TPA: gliding motility-associated protein GldE [Chitinophagales bacterium]|nr:gliding motility-associated protein GldE [Chitinophagales bacterium]
MNSSYTEVHELICNFHLLLIPSLRAEILIFCGSIIILLWISFLISGGEHALFSITPSQLNQVEKNSPRIFKNIQHLIVRPRHLLVLVKMLQMIINVTILFLAAKIGMHIFHGWSLSWIGFLIEIIFFILLLIMFQEIIPKYFGGKNSLLWAKWMGTPLYLLSNLFYPFVQFTIESSNFIEKRFESKNESNEEEVMQKPEEQLAGESQDTQDVSLLKGMLKFRTIIVRQIMRPRLDMVCVQEKISLDQLLRIVRDARYSRLPVYVDTMDKIEGVLYTKDLLTFLQDGKDRTWQSLIRPAYFVPEGKKISQLLVELQQQQMHLAVVIDEYGRTAGLVTLEDILEEIIGEIRDETDERIEVDYQQIDERNFILEGKTPVNDFCRIVGVPENFFDEVKSEADSLGGLLQEISGSIPQPNETIEYEGYVFTVLSLENYRIKKVKVTKPKQEQRTGSE